MKALLTVIGTAGLLILTACGGSSGVEAEANNSAVVTDNLALPPENSIDPLAGGADSLENQADALSTTNTVDANATGDLNVSSEVDLTANTSTANVANTQ